MDFVTIREFRSRPAEVWDRLEREKELVINRNGKPFAVLTRTQPQRLSPAAIDAEISAAGASACCGSCRR